MALTPRKILDLDPANEARDDDIIPVSQIVNTGGQRKTNGIRWNVLMARIIEIITNDRAGMVQSFVEQNEMLAEQSEALAQATAILQEQQNELLEAQSMLQTHQQELEDAQTELTAAQSSLSSQGQTLSAQQQEMAQAQASLQTQQTALTKAQQDIVAQNATITTLLEQIAAKKSVVVLPDVSIPASALITVQAAELTFTRPCVGIKTTDQIAVTPKALSNGYGFRGATVPANDQIAIKMWCPILSVGGTAQTFGVTAFR